MNGIVSQSIWPMSVSAFCFCASEIAVAAASFEVTMLRPIGRQAFLIHRVTIIRRDAGRRIDIQAVRHALVAVIDRNLVGGIDRHDLPSRGGDGLRHQEWGDRHGVERGIEVFLRETGRRVGGLHPLRRGEEAVRARESAEEMVEGFVLVENHENILHSLAQKRDLFLQRQLLLVEALVLLPLVLAGAAFSAIPSFFVAANLQPQIRILIPRYSPCESCVTGFCVTIIADEGVSVQKPRFRSLDRTLKSQKVPKSGHF